MLSRPRPSGCHARGSCGRLRAIQRAPVADGTIAVMDVIYLLQSAASPWLDNVALWVTQLGSEQVYIILLLIAFLVIDAEKGRSLALVFLLSFYLNQVLKEVFATQRPFQIDETVGRSTAAIETAPGNGFPSGHAQASMTFWGSAALYVKRRWFTVVAVVVVLAISLSRLYLGVHLPIDVIGGLALGALAVGVAAALERRQIELGGGAKLLLGVVLPLAVHLLFPLDESGVLLGALAAFVVGPELIKHDTSGPLLGRLILGVIGLALAFGILAASSAMLPEDLKRSALGSFFRYFLLALSGTALAPWLGRVSGLSGVRPRPTP